MYSTLITMTSSKDDFLEMSMMTAGKRHFSGFRQQIIHGRPFGEVAPAPLSDCHRTLGNLHCQGMIGVCDTPPHSPAARRRAAWAIELHSICSEAEFHPGNRLETFFPMTVRAAVNCDYGQTGGATADAPPSGAPIREWMADKETTCHYYGE
ncbi:hypothetical protein [Nocardiopsis chromatogenes]|uniref:hypothetical protein n=1 Tax=Nocardiopsis chromatogenes TaxID=280239 RepID=UPI001EF9F24A|nr:hypothetical protein [Nocardiopsis chromatogenes]